MSSKAYKSVQVDEDRYRLLFDALRSWERLTAVVASSLHAGEPYGLDLDIVRPDGTARYRT